MAGGSRWSAAVGAADDEVHVPDVDDLYWTETHWFAFAVPERRLTGCIYPVLRTNQRICSAGVYVWDHSGEAAHDLRYFHNYWHQPLPASLRSMALPCGLTFECLEPLRAWRVRYDDNAELALDLTYEGLLTFAPDPNALGGASGEPARPHHFDQPCHVTGRLRLAGEEIAVDCLEMRDKSWSPRTDARRAMPGPFRAAYCYGLASADSGFLATVMGTDGAVEQVRSGFLLRDGELAPLVSGERRAERERGRPTKVVIEAVDTSGRSMRAEGRCVNRFAFYASPGVFAWMSGTEWDLDGERAWGEDQEMAPHAQRLAEIHGG